ncbi:MAG: ABC transporter permease, partial [Nakamurella sp.]
MSNIVKVGRLHLVDRFGYTWLLWGIFAFTFLVNLAIYAVIPVTQPTGNYTGALVTIYIFIAVIGVQAATKFLPFAFTLGVSRRTYYLGTVGLVVGLCLLYSGILTVLWWVEGLTNGWGLQLHFFRVPWILDGPWYQVWLTNFA